MDILLKNEFAIKSELKLEDKPSVLRHEYKLYSKLQGKEGFPQIYGFIKQDDSNILIMSLLGPSLDKYIKYCSPKFSLETTAFLGVQMVKRVESLHLEGYIHRDIKPNNFALGTFNRRKPFFNLKDTTLYLIDLGLTVPYKRSTGEHISLSEDKFAGTPRYASINTHLERSQSRRDDLESIFYVLAYLLKGSLPWQGIKAKSKKEKRIKILYMKQDTEITDLFKGFPENLVECFKYIRGLGFEEEPDYSFILKCLESCLTKNSISFSWFDVFDRQMGSKGRKIWNSLYKGYPIFGFEYLLENIEELRRVYT